MTHLMLSQVAAIGVCFALCMHALADAPPPLDQRVGAIECRDKSIASSIDALSRETGIRMIVDWQSLGGEDQKNVAVNVSLNGCRLRDAIEALFPTAEVFSAKDGLHIVQREVAPNGVRAYPIGDLKAKLGFDADDQLTKLFEDHVRSDDWADNGGKFEIGIQGNFLLARQTMDGHEEIERLLDMLRKGMIRPANGDAIGSLNEELARRTNADSIQRRKLSGLRFRQAPLESALKSLQAESHVAAIIRWDQLEAAGIASTSPVTLDVSGLTLDQALDALCETAGMKHVFHNQTVEITTPDLAGHIAEPRVINARAIIDLQTGFNDARTGRGNQPDRQETLSIFHDMIESAVAPDSWKENGGSVGTLNVMEDCLVVQNRPRVNENISLLMSEVQAASQPASQPATAPPEVIDPLAAKLGDMVFDSIPLERAIEMLSERGEAKILVDWKALEYSGIERDTPVSARIYNTSLRRGLKVVLDLVGVNDVALAFRVDEAGIVHVSTAEMIGHNGIVHVYNIRDLIERHVSFHHSDSRDHLADREAVRQDAIDSITKMIEDTIDTDSWRDNGGSIGGLREFAGLLIVTNTSETHQKIKVFLEKLRLQPNITSDSK